MRETRVYSVLSGLIGESFNEEKVYQVIEVLRLYRKKGYSLAELDSLAFNESTGKSIFHLTRELFLEYQLKGMTYNLISYYKGISNKCR